MAYNNRGVARHQKGLYDQAISDYSKAIEINPNYDLAYFNRGLCHFKKGHCDKAWDDIKKMEERGYKVPPEILKTLQEASGKQI